MANFFRKHFYSEGERDFGSCLKDLNPFRFLTWIFQCNILPPNKILRVKMYDSPLHHFALLIQTSLHGYHTILWYSPRDNGNSLLQSWWWHNVICQYWLFLIHLFHSCSHLGCDSYLFWIKQFYSQSLLIWMTSSRNRLVRLLVNTSWVNPHWP